MRRKKADTTTADDNPAPVQIAVRPTHPAALAKALDAYRRQQGLAAFHISRNQAINALLEEVLRAKGFWPDAKST